MDKDGYPLILKPSRPEAKVPESAEQRALMRWAEYERGRYPELSLLLHIPNEGKRSAAAGGRLKAEGLRKGVPDLLLPVARGSYHGLFIEMKAIGEHPRPEQRQWLRDLWDAGYCAAVCQGCSAAIELILEYLEMERT